jgi:trehalose synthase
LETVEAAVRRLDSYRGVAPDEQLDEILALAQQFEGVRVLHLNATGFGGGAAEILFSLVPLMRDVGLDVEWRVMQGAPEFFKITKGLHNALQCMPGSFDKEAQDVYLRYSRENAEAFDKEYDFVVIHDPQPAAIRKLMLKEERGEFGCWIWRCHIDLTDTHEDAWAILRPYVEAHDAAIFTSEDYVKPDLEMDEVTLVWPSIDSLSPKNGAMAPEKAHAVIERYGINPDRPLLSQISRYDPWKDPVGAVDIYRMAKEAVPDLQLALVATMADDDPEGEEWLEKTARHAGEDPDVHLLASYEDNSEDVNAFQRGSDIVLQNSKREGFGLVVAEALWKGTPVVAHNAGSIPLQLRDGQDGYLVGSDEQAAQKIVSLLRDTEMRKKMGESGKEHIRQNFLVTRHLLDHLRLFSKLWEESP